MNTSVKLSVVMYVYNNSQHLAIGVKSILEQSFSDFELIIIDDASTDDSLSIIRSFHDFRIIIHSLDVHRGLVECFNYGILNASGMFIARANATDISLPFRFERQINFFQENTDYALCGTGYNYKNSQEDDFNSELFIDFHNEIKISLLFDFSIFSSTIMINRQNLKEESFLYESEFEDLEDYRLLTKLIKTGKLARLSEILVQRENCVSERPIKEELLNRIFIDQLQLLKINPTKLELEIHRAIFFKSIPSIKQLNPQHIIDWLRKLNLKNKKIKVYDDKLFKEYCLLLLDFMISFLSFKSHFIKRVVVKEENTS